MEKEFRKLQLMAYGMIGLIVLVIIVSAFRQFYLTLLLLAAVLFLQVFVFRRKQKEYTADAVRANLQNTVCPLLNTDKVITLTGGNDSGSEGELVRNEIVRAIRDSDFFKVLDKEGAVNVFVAVNGYYGKAARRLRVTTADVSITVPVEGAKISADIVTGNWIRLVFPMGTDLKEEALPDQFRSRLGSLKRFTPGKVFYRVKGDSADVFIQNRFLDAGFSPRVPVTAEMLRNDPLPELGKVLDMFYPLTDIS